MAEIAIDRLRGFVLPESSSYRRDAAVPPEWQDDKYRATYDDRTLFYDCTYLEDRQAYLFSAPRMTSLRQVLKRGLRHDGRPVRLRHRSSGRSAQVFLPGPKGRLSLDIEGQSHLLEVRPALSGIFRGLNCAVTINKNNELAWIRDWIRYHISAHGLEGVVIFDNGSDRYSLETLGDALRDIPGLKRAALLHAPFPYGSVAQGPKGAVRTKYLQTAVINLARHDMCAGARAVLNGDVDEIITAQSGRSVFDAAVAHRFAFVRLGGEWVFPRPSSSTEPKPQAAHVFRSDPPTKCNSKWCATPTSLLSRRGWNVHNIGERVGRYISADPDFTLLHCSATTSGWKEKSTRFKTREGLREDPDLVALMARHLGNRGSAT